MDIYFFQSVLNIFWSIFSIIFVLYRFTSFFSYIYNFFKFFGRITQVVAYIKDKLQFTTNTSQYITPRETFFSRFKKGTYYIMGYGEIVKEEIIPENTNLFESHTTTWLNGDPNQISYSALNVNDQEDEKVDYYELYNRPDFGPFTGYTKSEINYDSVNFA